MRITQVVDSHGNKKLMKLWEPDGYPFEPEAVQQIENMAGCRSCSSTSR